MSLIGRAALVGGFLARASGIVRAQAVPVTGRVTDAQGGVVVNASVTLFGGPGVRPVVVRSTADGTFTFTAIPPGRYTLQIGSPGFKPGRRRLRHARSRPRHADAHRRQGARAGDHLIGADGQWRQT